MTDPPRTSLLALPWVQSLAIALGVVLAFGSNLEGELVWDDDQVIGPAAALRGPWDAFSADLFGTGAGAGAKYWRPLVTLSYWLDIRAFASAPHVGMHFVNLVWHAAAAILVLRALRRWTGAEPGTSADAASFAAAACWAVLPLKAENVAWISGRGDVMGLVFGLVGLELAGRARTTGGRAAAAAVGTALALLCKESMAALPALFAGAALIDARRADQRATEGLRPHALAALRAPQTWASAAMAVGYLALRSALLPIASGGQGMLQPVGALDKAVLFLETTGTAAVALLTPWRSELLRGPIAFHGPTDLVTEPWRAAVGAAVLAIAIALAIRAPAARAPLAIGLGTFLPVSNLIPMGLEARVSDRFLYLPTLGLALGVAIALVQLVPRPRLSLAATGLVVCAVLLGVAASRRAALFASNDALFAWEVQHGEGALAVLNNGALAAQDSRRYRDARDLRLRELARYHELGFSGEGFAQLYEAIRMQVLATGEEHAPSLEGHELLARALLEGSGARIPIELDDGRVLVVDTDNPIAVDLGAAWKDRLRVDLALVLARRGEVEPALALAEQGVAVCVRCRAVRVTAAEVAAAALRPELVESRLETIPAWESRREELLAVARAQRSLLGRQGVDQEGAEGRALALFVGAAYAPACRTARSSGQVMAPPARRALAAACLLAADPTGAALVLGEPIDETLAARLRPLRYRAADRIELARAGSAPARPEL